MGPEEWIMHLVIAERNVDNNLSARVPAGVSANNLPFQPRASKTFPSRAYVTIFPPSPPAFVIMRAGLRIRLEGRRGGGKNGWPTEERGPTRQISVSAVRASTDLFSLGRTDNSTSFHISHFHSEFLNSTWNARIDVQNFYIMFRVSLYV